jgi:hypothetical protein
MTRSCSVIALVLLLTMTVSLAPGAAVPAGAQAKPEGEMCFAFYVTISPAWFGPVDVR